MTRTDTWKAAGNLLRVETAIHNLSASMRRRLKETRRGMSREELEQVADWLEKQSFYRPALRSALQAGTRRGC
jgi:hypothetical protein